MRTIKFWLLLVVIGFIMIAAGCSTETTTDVSARNLLPESQPISALFQDHRLPGMKGIADNGKLQLYINDQTAEVAVLDKRSGVIWRSNPEKRDSDTIASGVNKDMLSAQTRINFYNSYGQMSSVNSYTDSVAHGQIALELIDQGIRVSYQFGKEERGIDDLPQKLSKERYEELVAKMDSAGERAMRLSYTLDKETGVYTRIDGALQGLQLQRTLAAFDAIGYTAEDLARDSEEHGLTYEKPIPRIFGISIEYSLDGDNLLVRVPASSIRYPEEYPVNYFTLLNFFGAGGTEERGSLFVPDGSGALIHFNNGKQRYPAYQQDVYGKDLTLDNTDHLNRDQKIRLPVFGLIRENSALLGIIEQGASVAVINADVSGRLNSYNYVYPSFYVINKDEVTLNAGGEQRTLPMFQEEPMNTDYVVRYAFLNGEDADYSGMAHYYRQYLIDRQVLAKPQEVGEKDSPFYLQLIGSIERRKHILGMPFRMQEPLTTFAEAKTIVSELKESGVQNIRLKLSGWFNGGLNHRKPNHVKVNGSLGGKKGLQDLMSYAREAGIVLYPEVDVVNVSNSRGLRESKEVARRLTRAPALVYPIDMATNRKDRDRAPSYVLSPRFIPDMVDSMLQDLRSLGVSSLALHDLADVLNSDYRKKMQIDRTESERINTQALQSLRDAGLTLMADGGNAYALAYVSEIMNVPLSSSLFKLEDESIPFYQMVIRGYVDYTGEPYNLSAYTNPRQYILKLLEYGSGPSFTWIYGPNYVVKDTEFDYLYSVHYKEWFGLAAEMYQTVNGVLRHVSGQPIVSHERLADGVYRTVYGNGYEVTVNYNNVPVTVDGATIEAEGFRAGGGRS